MTEKAPEKSTVTLPGTVKKIIESPHPALPEKAEISVVEAEPDATKAKSAKL